MSPPLQVLTPYSPFPVVRQEHLEEVVYHFLKFHEYRLTAALTALENAMPDERRSYLSAQLRKELMHILAHMGRWAALSCFPHFLLIVQALLQSIKVSKAVIYVLSPELMGIIPSYHALMDGTISTLDWWNWEVGRPFPLPAELKEAFSNYVTPELLCPQSSAKWIFPDTENSQTTAQTDATTDDVPNTSTLESLTMKLDDKAAYMDLRAQGSLRLSRAILVVADKSRTLGRLPEVSDFGGLKRIPSSLAGQLGDRAASGSRSLAGAETGLESRVPPQEHSQASSPAGDRIPRGKGRGLASPARERSQRECASLALAGHIAHGSIPLAGAQMQSRSTTSILVLAGEHGPTSDPVTRALVKSTENPKKSSQQDSTVKSAKDLKVAKKTSKEGAAECAKAAKKTFNEVKSTEGMKVAKTSRSTQGVKTVKSSNEVKSVEGAKVAKKTSEGAKMAKTNEVKSAEGVKTASTSTVKSMEHAKAAKTNAQVLTINLTSLSECDSDSPELDLGECSATSSIRSLMPSGY
ncbi:unnamed protein product [Cyclocybe aegerita]|uniref:Uncharacterized protein n=1 Tax=Cyclocybe aegerita TaxID=1973307 RepID=A0A8S0WB40_CYCAE|nr:unnamed protein product [Cyclocybe aegerita]